MTWSATTSERAVPYALGMARIDIPHGDGGDAAMVWSLRPEMGSAIGQLVDAAYKKSRLPAREREAARMRVAQLNDCPI